MNIQAEKIELVKLLLNTENLGVIESIKKIFEEEKTFDFWDHLSLQQQREIEIASLEIEKEEVTNYESFIQKHR
ncbi:MAG: hypothetical protein ACPGTO_01090 [Polaribacter sp.]